MCWIAAWPHQIPVMYLIEQIDLIPLYILTVSFFLYYLYLYLPSTNFSILDLPYYAFDMLSLPYDPISLFQLKAHIMHNLYFFWKFDLPLIMNLLTFGSFDYSYSYALKFLVLISLLIFIRGGIPRYRFDFLTKLGWVKFLSLVLSFFIVCLLYYYIF